MKHTGTYGTEYHLPGYKEQHTGEAKRNEGRWATARALEAARDARHWVALMRGMGYSDAGIRIVASQWRVEVLDDGRLQWVSRITGRTLRTATTPPAVLQHRQMLEARYAASGAEGGGVLEH